MLNTTFHIYLVSRWKSIAVWSICMIALALVFTAIYDSFKGEFTDIFDNAPKLMEAMLGPIPTDSIISPEIWLGIELYGLLFPIIFAAIAISSGASAVGLEEDSGTIELLLASPISRERIILEKSLAILAQLAIISTCLWLGIAMGSFLFPCRCRSAVHRRCLDTWRALRPSSDGFFLKVSTSSITTIGMTTVLSPNWKMQSGS